jgi:hypothetical protein
MGLFRPGHVFFAGAMSINRRDDDSPWRAEPPLADAGVQSGGDTDHSEGRAVLGWTLCLLARMANHICARKRKAPLPVQWPVAITRTARRCEVGAEPRPGSEWRKGGGVLGGEGQ